VGGHEKSHANIGKEGFGLCIEGGKKLKCRAFIAYKSQSESGKIPWDSLQV